MDRLKIDVMGISKVWPSNGLCIVDNHKAYHSDNENNKDVYRVGQLFHVECKTDYIINFITVSERIIVLLLIENTVDIDIMPFYPPTTDAEVAEIDQFYSEIPVLLRRFKKNYMTVIIGDFNAKIGIEKCGNLVGKYCRSVKNECGDRMKLFLKDEDLMILNILS